MMTVPQAFDLALQYHRAGRLTEAEPIYRQVLAAQPHHIEARHMLGVIAHQTGRHDLAVEWLQGVVAVAPNNAAAHSNLGEAYRALDRLAAAIASYRRALQLDPNFADAYNNLGVALWSAGQLDEAISACQQAIRLRSEYAEAYYNLGNAFRDRGQSDDAIAAYHHALEVRTDYPKVHNNLGNALWDQGRLGDAVASYRRALEGMPHDAGVHSNLIMALHYLPGDTSGMIAAEQQNWNRQFGEPMRKFLPPPPNDRNPERRLRIGYVSPDLWDHVTGRNLLPLFRHHERTNFEIVCYAGVVRPDGLTEEFRRHCDRWVDALPIKDDDLAQMIRRDEIDILVDLSQHGGGNRLPVFARQPAPVQVSFAGYPESTGVEAIQHRISDRWLENNAECGERNAESGALGAAEFRLPTSDFRLPERVRLIDSFWCYDPCGVDVPVNDLPAHESGRVTFGSLNTFRKINEAVLRLWARVLGQVGGARLVLLSAEGRHRQRPLEILAQAGLDPGRVEFVTPRARREYLELYHRLDLALDPFPYNGHTTSLDALRMGVPVVSLAGASPVSRAGLSQASNLGLAELVAFTDDDYVRIATELAQDLPRLASLRETLRPRMESSVLMDAPRFARQIEAAYRAMWRQWCGEEPA